MLLRCLSEGEINAALLEVSQLKNDIALGIGRSLRDLGITDIKVSEAEDSSDDAILYADFGGKSAMVRVIADDDIQIELPDELSLRLNIPDYYRAGGAVEVIARFRNIIDQLRQ